MDRSSEEIQFSWGKRRSRGGTKMDTQFYDGFTFDNVKYSLYDCVYLFKNGDPEPHIGKIVKIWEQNLAKKVKILWFFLPDEIKKYLGDPLMEKEIFLASGVGTGLADINPLEAIAGKCSVICTSKDERNRQPSAREQAMADYIFYRFFDVGSCTLSDQAPEKIAGLEVNVLLNPKDEQVTTIPGEVNVDEGLVAAVAPTQSVVKEENISPVTSVSHSQSAVKDEDENPAAALLQSVVKKEDQKPAAIFHSQPAIKREHQKPVVDIPHFQSAAKEDEQPVASTPPPPPPPRSTAVTKIPRHTQNAPSGQRPQKKLKSSSQEVTVQNQAPAVPDKRPLELTSRQTDRSKWFNIPWDDRLRMADEKGTLVYIQNLDIQFGAADIEGLIHEALQLSCIAKPINHPTYDDPNNGKAYAIFKTKSAADIAISKINSGLVVGGRPLYCSKGLLKVPKSVGTLVGHLSLYNIKIGPKQREEQKKAVSTSHCSQPNTIEYDLALEWMLIRAKQEKKFRILHKKHKDDRKAFANMGSKKTKTGK